MGEAGRAKPPEAGPRGLAAQLSALAQSGSVGLGSDSAHAWGVLGLLWDIYQTAEGLRLVGLQHKLLCPTVCREIIAILVLIRSLW